MITRGSAKPLIPKTYPNKFILSNFSLFFK
ncbi:hypothetical protein SAMN05518861_13639 [Mesorhizobium sp. YR577]|nr:hypothetical protein SAMN05518861_13639 [Mesorhizobium sp. YR577]